MKNITLTIDEDILEWGEDYAKRHNTSLNGLVQDLLEQTVKPRGPNVFEEIFREMDEANKHKDWLEEVFRFADEAHGNSEGRTWTKEQINDRSFGREPKSALNE